MASARQSSKVRIVPLATGWILFQSPGARQAKTCAASLFGADAYFIGGREVRQHFLSYFAGGRPLRSALERRDESDAPERGDVVAHRGVEDAALAVTQY